MPIDFQAAGNAGAYSGRAVDKGWSAIMRTIVDPAGRRVVDIGCGGGLYSIAWTELGAAAVVGVDSSPGMVDSAVRATAQHPQIEVRIGRADATGLPAEAFDVAFERALIHHLASLPPAIHEAWRLLRPGGRLIVQDRTMDDVMAPASPDHLRGYFFAAFPRLLEVEAGRRPGTEEVFSAMRACGFRDPRALRFWETRKIYASADELARDLQARKGRSLLHELDDDELGHLVKTVMQHMPAHRAIAERDRWTVWTAAKHE